MSEAERQKLCKALRSAVEALQKQVKFYAVNANLHDQYKLETPGTVEASKKHREALEAIQVILGMAIWDKQDLPKERA